MPKFDGFVGPSNVQRSRWVDAERTVNWFVEFSGVGTPKVSAALYPTAGLKLFAWLSNGPVTQLFYQDGRCFGVSGGVFYEIFGNKTATQRGLVAQNGWPATISSSGDGGLQLFITSGGKGYIFDLTTNDLTQITDDAFPDVALAGLFFDQYFIVLDAATGAFFLSTLDDGFSWNALDFGAESQFSDRVIAFTKMRDNLLLYGTQNGSPWFNSGNPSFPFQPAQSTIIEHGTAAPFAHVEIENTNTWLGADIHGSGVVWALDGYTPVKISTPALEYQLSTVRNYQQARAFGYQMQGHPFYVLQVPGLDTTWVYDYSTRLWHEWALWNPKRAAYERHLAICHCYGFNRHLVGDRQSGAVYELSFDFPTDDIVIVAN